MTHVLGWELAGYGIAAVVASVVLASALVVKFDLYREAVLSACSLFLCSFLVFGLVELFPDLARSLHLTSVHYYALLERYITDESLIFRIRPFYQLKRNSYTGYKGDLYKPVYGIEVPEIAYEGTYDKHGFRNAGGDRDGDVVVLGDSFIEIGESDTDLFTKQLEHISGLKTANLGLAWYGPFQYLEVLKRYGVERKPKYAVLSFFEGNDLNDIREYMHWTSGGDYYHFNLSSRGVLGRYRLAVRETVQYFTSRGTLSEETRAAKESRDGATVHPDLVDLKLGDKHFKARFGYAINTADIPQIIRSDEWKELRQLLTEFRKVCAEHRIVPLLMFIPTKAHIYAEYTTEQSGTNWKNIRETQIAAKDNMRDAFSGLSDELQIQLIDLTPVFERSAQEGKLLYYPFDTHWNPAAREAAAEAVAKVLGALQHDQQASKLSSGLAKKAMRSIVASMRIVFHEASRWQS